MRETAADTRVCPVETVALRPCMLLPLGADQTSRGAPARDIQRGRSGCRGKGYGALRAESEAGGAQRVAPGRQARGSDGTGGRALAGSKSGRTRYGRQEAAQATQEARARGNDRERDRVTQGGESVRTMGV